MDDWELLHGSDTESTDSITSNKKSASLIDDGMILSDHFSADTPTGLSQYDVIESGDDSSRVNYDSELRNQVEVVVDQGLDQLNVNQSSDDFLRNEIGFYDSKIGTFGDGEVRLSDFEAVNEKVVAELTGGSVSHYEDASKCLSEADDIDVGDGGNVESQSGVEVEQHIEDTSNLCSDSGDNEVVNAEEEENEGNEIVEVVAANSGDESKSRETVTVWWKMPFVLLKYSVFRIGPVWSVSMAAAVMGLVLLGRRLYNMKKKAQRFHLKVAIDDKKVSRVMSQAARLNEAFTEVRRVPVIRPALPSPVAWPVLSLR